MRRSTRSAARSTSGLAFRRREQRDDCVAPGMVARLRHRIFDGVLVGVEWSNNQVRGALKRAAQHYIGHFATVGDAGWWRCE